jgi:hypothetical protein
MTYKYFKPKSVTWWVSFTALSSGFFQLTGIDIPVLSEYVRPVINAVHQDISPSALFQLGLAGIGLRGALKD